MSQSTDNTKDIYSQPESAVMSSDRSTIDSPSIVEILFSFKGRINRMRYWLAYLVFYFVIFALFGLFAATGDPDRQPPLWALLFYIPLIWVGLALQIKRFHDRNKSGWWIFIGMIPIVGPFWILIELGFLSGDSGTNRFGNPVV